MAAITDEYMQEMLTKTKEYHLVLLKPAPGAGDRADLKKLLWEHARRNFSLRADGLLPIVGPITAETGLSGIGIFNANAEETKNIMDGDPAVQAGIFVYEIHPCRSFPGDRLP
jgi:uncharacterized protein YciI